MADLMKSGVDRCGAPGFAPSDKKALRKSVLARRDGLPSETRASKDRSIHERLLALPEFQAAKTLLLYASFRSEVGTEALTGVCLNLGKTTLFPRVDREILRLYEIRNTGDLKPGCWGIPEPLPEPDREMQIEAVDLVVVPGAAFDTGGNRLGYGKGYYDRLLAVRKSGLSRPIAVGLAYEEQVVPSIPPIEYDIPMDLIITDRRTIRCHG